MRERRGASWVHLAAISTSDKPRRVRMGCEPDGCDVPRTLHLRRDAEPVLRRNVHPPAHPSSVRDAQRVRVVGQPVPRLQSAVLAGGPVQRRIDCARVRRQQLPVEVEHRNVHQRVFRQRVPVAAAELRRGVSRSVLLQRAHWALLRDHVRDGVDAVRVQPPCGRWVRVVQQPLPRLQRAIRQLRVRQREIGRGVRPHVHVGQRHLHVLGLSDGQGFSIVSHSAFVDEA